MSGFNVFGLLRCGEIVGSDGDHHLLVTWNGSLTFILWAEDGGWFTQVDAWTVCEVPTREQARESARAHIEQAVADDDAA